MEHLKQRYVLKITDSNGPAKNFRIGNRFFLTPCQFRLLIPSRFHFSYNRAHAGAARFNYSVEITGVGRLKESDPEVGFATQIAVFLDTQPEADPIFSEFGKYQDIEHIVFPYYDEPEKSNGEIV